MRERRAQGKTTREALLTTAAAIVRRDGVARLTLETVAAGAGVSKGGLLYHFPTKEALIGGLVTAMQEAFAAAIEAHLAAEPPAPGRWARAYLQASFQASPEQRPDTIIALLTAVATNPALLDASRRQYQVWAAQGERDGIDPAVAALVRLAADGLWLADLFDLAPPPGPLRERVLALLRSLTEEAPA
jgi:AcrR family transcriptional regulator